MFKRIKAWLTRNNEDNVTVQSVSEADKDKILTEARNEILNASRVLKSSPVDGPKAVGYLKKSRTYLRKVHYPVFTYIVAKRDALIKYRKMIAHVESKDYKAALIILYELNNTLYNMKTML